MFFDVWMLGVDVCCFSATKSVKRHRIRRTTNSADTCATAQEEQTNRDADRHVIAVPTNTQQQSTDERTIVDILPNQTNQI